MDKRRITSRIIRPDFQCMPVITLAEAGSLAGVSYRTVQKWLSVSRSGRALFRRGYLAGPFQVDRPSFEAFLRTGQPQGELRK